LLDSLERAKLVGFGQRLGTGKLVVADELGGEPVELFVEHRLDPFDVDARPDGRPARGDRRAAGEAEREDRDVLGDALITDETPVEPAALATRQDLAGEVERVKSRVTEDGRPVADVDARQGHLVVDDFATL